MPHEVAVLAMCFPRGQLLESSVTDDTDRCVSPTRDEDRFLLCDSVEAGPGWELLTLPSESRVDGARLVGSEPRRPSGRRRTRETSPDRFRVQRDGAPASGVANDNLFDGERCCARISEFEPGLAGDLYVGQPVEVGLCPSGSSNRVVLCRNGRKAVVDLNLPVSRSAWDFDDPFRSSSGRGPKQGKFGGTQCLRAGNGKYLQYNLRRGTGGKDPPCLFCTEEAHLRPGDSAGGCWWFEDKRKIECD